MNVNIKEDNKHRFDNLTVGDLFNLEGDWWILVQTKEGFSISNMNYSLYLNYKTNDTRFNDKFATKDDIKKLLLEVEKEVEIAYYSKEIFDFNLEITKKY